MTEEPFVLPVGTNPDLSDIKKALCIVAHPDDIDYGCGGAVATMTKQGIEVAYALITSGDAGGDLDEGPGEARMAMREEEQRAAGQVHGVRTIHYLRQPDGQIEANLALREKVTRLIRKEKPDLVITQSPERRYDRIFASHPDHLAVGEATVSACYPDAQNPHAFSHLVDEGLAPHTVKAIWIMADEKPDVYLDITDVMDQKLEALFCHQSQIADQDYVRKMMTEWAKLNAAEGSLPKGRMAESFRFVQIMY
jgi:LmbE family N-acetylglucosaminyl deacetylase